MPKASSLSWPRGWRGQRLPAPASSCAARSFAGGAQRERHPPKGVTAEALAVLMGKDGLGDLLKRAVAAAAKRSRELSS